MVNKHKTLWFNNKDERIIKFKTKKWKIIYKKQMPDWRYFVINKI